MLAYISVVYGVSREGDYSCFNVVNAVSTLASVVTYYVNVHLFDIRKRNISLVIVTDIKLLRYKMCLPVKHEQRLHLLHIMLFAKTQS